MKGRPGIFSTKCVEQAPGQRVAPAERHECAQRRTPKSPRMPMPLPMRPAIAPAFVPFEESAPAYSNFLRPRETTGGKQKEERRCDDGVSPRSAWQRDASRANRRATRMAGTAGFPRARLAARRRRQTRKIAKRDCGDEHKVERSPQANSRDLDQSVQRCRGGSRNGECAAPEQRKHLRVRGVTVPQASPGCVLGMWSAAGMASGICL